MISATITARGQITIPAEIREALKLDAGDRIVFEEAAPGSYAFKPAQKVKVTVLKGMFGKPNRIVSVRARPTDGRSTVCSMKNFTLLESP